MTVCLHVYANLSTCHWCLQVSVENYTECIQPLAQLTVTLGPVRSTHPAYMQQNSILCASELQACVVNFKENDLAACTDHSKCHMAAY